jgi:carbon monoxide dehydrogenase subunit G
MEFNNSFEVPLPPDEAWKILLDIERIAPCMPGAELTEVVDQNTYKGKIGVRLGPVALTFAGIVKFEQIDGATRTARVAAPMRLRSSGSSRRPAAPKCWCTPI